MFRSNIKMYDIIFIFKTYLRDGLTNFLILIKNEHDLFIYNTANKIRCIYFYLCFHILKHFFVVNNFYLQINLFKNVKFQYNSRLLKILNICIYYIIT